MNVLVTGGTGVVGTAAISALLRDGHKVRLLSRHAERDVAGFPAGLEPFAADIGSPETLPGAVVGCDVVLHSAGVADEEPPEVTFDRINVEGTRALLQSATNAGRPAFVYVSSLGADTGHSAYHESKRRAEALVRAYAGRWIIVRPSGVYGPGDDTLSPLLKMVRTLPAVPIVAGGDQPFQPIWHADLGEVLAQLVQRNAEFAGATLDVAGLEVTTTDAVLQALCSITGRHLPRLSVPVWVTEVGVQALDAFGGAGKKLLHRAGLDAPVSTAKLDMLLEENVIRGDRHNALTDFVAEPTRLEDGLEMLVDLLPEQLPGDGVGDLRHTTFWAEISGTGFSAAQLLDRVCERINDLTPVEFSAENAPAPARAGQTITGSLPARGHFQVRLEERTPGRATFLTVEGHPLAGVMQLHAEDVPDGVRFSVHLAAQPANAFDWLAMQFAGGPMQHANWRGFLRRVIELSGGRAPRGIHHDAYRMTEQERRDIRTFTERLVHRRTRFTGASA